MASKYIDPTAIIQTIGCVYNNPSLLDFTDKYIITENDFQEQLHKVIFGSIYKLYELGAKVITLENIADFLEERPKSKGVYESQNGAEWLLKASNNARPDAFDYYYSRLKKFSLLRAYDNYGIDVSFIYDPNNIFDVKKKQLQEDQLDNTRLADLAQKVDDRISAIRAEYVDQVYGESYQAGEGIEDLINSFKEHPEVGIPLYGPLINTVTRGARLKKFYLRSAPSGTGKTRMMIADACYIACNRIYDDSFGWLKNGTAEPTVYITTEQDKSEIQTMMLAFLANVNEDHILDGRYEGDEEQRVFRAAQILKDSPLYIEVVPDFSLKDIEDIIERNIRENDVKYVMHDYVHTSLKILEEISSRSGGVKLREDNVLFMLSVKLKDIANKHGVFILSATQLNGDYVESETPDQNLLRGAKSIADKIDVGLVLLPVRDKDIDSLQTILSANAFEKPILKLSVYKNRRGKYKGIYLWCKGNLSTCRVIPQFATTWNYELIQMDDLKIYTDDPGAFPETDN